MLFYVFWFSVISFEWLIFPWSPTLLFHTNLFPRKKILIRFNARWKCSHVYCTLPHSKESECRKKEWIKWVNEENQQPSTGWVHERSYETFYKRYRTSQSFFELQQRIDTKIKTWFARFQFVIGTQMHFIINIRLYIGFYILFFLKGGYD